MEDDDAVPLELYVRLRRAADDRGLDDEASAALAAAQGVGRAEWQGACGRWAERVAADDELGQLYARLYEAAGR